MTDLFEGILSEFADAQQVTSPMSRLDWRQQGWHLSREHSDHAKRAWAAQNKDLQREYAKKWRDANGAAYHRARYAEAPRKRTEADKERRRRRYAELRASGLSSAEISSRS